MIETTRRHRMIDAFKATHGEEVAMTLADSLDLTDLATKADLEPLATKADLKVLETRLDSCATKADLKVLETRLDSCATKADLKGEMNRQLRWMITTLVAFLGAVVGLIVAVMRSVA